VPIAKCVMVENVAEYGVNLNRDSMLSLISGEEGIGSLMERFMRHIFCSVISLKQGYPRLC
jgi:hypothetical protein